MDEVLWKLHRIQKHREREARMELVRAERKQHEQEARLRATTHAMARAREEVTHDDAVELVTQQTWALRMEMTRRHAESGLLEQSRQVKQQQDVLVGRAKEARVTERVAEVRHEARQRAQSRRSDRAMSEIGLQAWWRRTA